MLTLLRREKALPGMQSQLHAYLSRSRRAADAFDVALPVPPSWAVWHPE
jgi:hypothetical protein